MEPWKRRFLLETTIFRGYVSFRECTPWKINILNLKMEVFFCSDDFPDFKAWWFLGEPAVNFHQGKKLNCENRSWVISSDSFWRLCDGLKFLIESIFWTSLMRVSWLCPQKGVQFFRILSKVLRLSSFLYTLDVFFPLNSLLVLTFLFLSYFFHVDFSVSDSQHPQHPMTGGFLEVHSQKSWPHFTHGLDKNRIMGCLTMVKHQCVWQPTWNLTRTLQPQKYPRSWRNASNVVFKTI